MKKLLLIGFCLMLTLAPRLQAYQFDCWPKNSIQVTQNTQTKNFSIELKKLQKNLHFVFVHNKKVLYATSNINDAKAKEIIQTNRPLLIVITTTTLEEIDYQSYSKKIWYPHMSASFRHKSHPLAIISFEK